MRRILRITIIILIPLIAICIGLSIWGGSLLRQSLADFPAVGKFVEVAGTRLHYVERGSGRPVVMIHGSDGVLQDFTLTIFDSVATGFHALAFDRPGHGYSGRPLGEPMTLTMAARLIHQACTELGLTRPIMMGHSYGGAVALQYALDYPADLSGLVLLAPACYSDGVSHLRSGRRAMKVLGPVLGRTLFVPLGRMMEPAIIKPSFDPDPVDTAYMEILREFSPRPEQFRSLADEVVMMGEGLDALVDRYHDISVPTVVVAGDADGMTEMPFSGNRLVGQIPKAELVVLPGAGHMVHHVHPEATLAALRRVVQRIDAEMIQ
jgi:pimeloyl-ACP methyl ester carboxylesterase